MPNLSWLLLVLTGCNAWAVTLEAETIEAVGTSTVDWRPEGMGETVWTEAVAAWSCAASQGKVASTTLTIIDFSVPSDVDRLWVVDLASSRTQLHERVAHGSGSGGRFATSFSNAEGSHQTSLGLYRTAEVYSGKHGRSLRLDGLEPANSAARKRAIVIHAADYVDDAFVAANGRAGRSWGCPALDPDIAQDVIDAIAGRSLVFAWHSDPDWRQTSPWLHCADPG